MTTRQSIESDVEALKRYFERLFSLLSELSEAAAEPTDEEYVADPTAFVRPDMASNIYSLVDFWLSRLSKIHQERWSLPLSHKDIRGDNDLHAYYKYLTKVVRLPLDHVAPSLNQLHNLRRIRKWLIHSGGHVESEKEASKLEAIPGVSFSGTLVLLSDEFIWDCLEQAKLYLCAVAEASPP